METVGLSLRHSCRSELTRQGISLDSQLPRRSEAASSELTLHVAMQFGLYLHVLEGRVRRVVSEDSGHATGLSC